MSIFDRLHRLVARYDTARARRRTPGPVLKGWDLRCATPRQLGLSGSGYDDHLGGRPLDDDEQRAFDRATHDYRAGQG